MTPSQIQAYNAGVLAVLDIARAISDALAPRLVEQPTRFNFAMGALDGLANEGRALLLTGEHDAPSPPAGGAPKPMSPASGALLDPAHG